MGVELLAISALIVTGRGGYAKTHPEVPWTGGDGCCGAPGMPCECNSEAMPPPGSKEVVNWFGHTKSVMWSN